jgi:hypothetical protein
MANDPRFICPTALAMNVVWREVARLERRGPDPELARQVLHLAREVELRTGTATPRPPSPGWARYMVDCALVEA